MKHLRKFEELQYSTYTSAAKKLAGHGQFDRADKVNAHATQRGLEDIHKMDFDILVGNVRTIPNAKFEKLTISKETSARSLMMIFKANDNTYKVQATISDMGDVSCREEFNKFANRRSVNEYQKALKILATFQPDFKKMLSDMHISPESIKVVSRTFYI